MGQGGGLVLVLVATRSLWGLRGAHRSHPNQDKHQAPSSTPPRPLSLQDPGPQAYHYFAPIADLSALGGCDDVRINLLMSIIGPLSVDVMVSAFKSYSALSAFADCSALPVNLVNFIMPGEEKIAREAGYIRLLQGRKNLFT